MHGEPRAALAVHRAVAAKIRERGPCAPLAASVKCGVFRQALSRFLRRRRVLCGLGSDVSAAPELVLRRIPDGPSGTLTSWETRHPGPVIPASAGNLQDPGQDVYRLWLNEKLNMFKCSFFFKSSACGDQGLGVMLDILHAYRHLEVELQTESKLEMKHRVRNPWTKEAPTSDSHSHPVTPSHVLLFRPDREAHEPATNPRLFTASVD
ncbi:hypothetical protein MJG53_012274 [Ovis ammon polii x Ovis aries]|uniref:Uncharacterized protein n=1 Tax=Ovis ammon polii x Ovis aries TaxID=2918886 RepID=A0ACB9UN14_9CETA|nr:hypothetical protein MJT46_011898 [Ovis ammon polii x Ovis aries]KAI4574098.1 hypothetical protein MJG53_012274 [Ovis ammon polii x Ovis aries]